MGERFELEPVRRITDLDEAEALGAVRAALELEILREDGSGGFRFRHALTRDAVYGRLLVLERRRVHGRVAETLAGQDTERAAEVAFHYEAAGDAERARRFAESAAERAMALGALADARVHLRTALRVTWGVRERARLLAQLGTIEHEIGDMPAAMAAAQGTTFAASMRALLAEGGPADRAGILAAIYLISYSGAAIPSLIAGQLSRSLDLFEVALGYGVLAALAFVVTLATTPSSSRQRKASKSPAPGDPGEHVTDERHTAGQVS